MSYSNERVAEYSRTDNFELTSQELHSAIANRDLYWLPDELKSDISCLGKTQHLVHARIFGQENNAYLELINFAELVPEEMVEGAATAMMLYICPITFRSSERHYMYGGVLHCIPERSEDDGQAFWQKDVTSHLLPVRHYTEMTQEDLDRWEEFLDMEADFPYSPIRALEDVAVDVCRDNVQE